MAQISDKAVIRELLQRDPRWCVYALGDLTPRMFAKCRWFTPDLTLVLHDYETSILFAHGTRSIHEALEHVTYPVHLQVQADALAEVAKYVAVTNVKDMQRMVWAAEDAERRTLAALDPRAIRLTATHVPAIERLYADGLSSGESPDFFYASMVSDGVFRGVFEGEELVAVAGTHLVSRDEGAAAIGNVYVRRDRRGAGLSRTVTASVVNDLRGIETIGLNVRRDNAAAIRVYESLGFVHHCDFHEALAGS